MRGRVLRRSLRVGGQSSVIYVSPDAQLKYLKRSGDWDRDLISLAETHIKAGMEVWDIGANVGVLAFSASLQTRNGRVFAFEPDTFLCEVMKRTKRGGSFGNVQIIPMAVSREVGIAEFLIAQRGRASNSLASAGGRSQTGGVRESLLVPTISGDTFAQMVQGRPDFIKIDVEGAECDVLQGLAETLGKCRPIVYIEVSSKSADEVYAVFDKLNYSYDKKISVTGNVLFKP